MNVAQAIRAAVAELTRRKKESGAKSKARVLYAEYINCSGNERDRQIALGERILAFGTEPQGLDPTVVSPGAIWTEIEPGFPTISGPKRQH